MGQIVTLQVEGMDCAACERRLRALLGGVGQVDADHVTGRVRVRFDAGRVETEMVRRRAAEQAEQAGFTVTGGRQQDEGARP